MSESEHDEILAETSHVRLVNRNGWNFVQRTRATGVVSIIGVTKNDEYVFVEQHRPALAQSVIEFPAGLAGDIAGAESESLEEAARRELLEETGYEAGSLRQVCEVVSSAGLTDETITMFLAFDLEKTGSGGGRRHRTNCRPRGSLPGRPSLVDFDSIAGAARRCSGLRRTLLVGTVPAAVLLNHAGIQLIERMPTAMLFVLGRSSHRFENWRASGQDETRG